MRKVFPYFKYLKPCLKIFVLGLFFGIMNGLMSGFGLPFFVEGVWRDTFETDVSRTLIEAIGIGILLPGAFLVRGVSAYFNQVLLNYCGISLVQGIRMDLHAKLVGLHLSYFEKHKSGDLMSRVSADTGQMQRVVLSMANELVRQTVTLIGGLCALGWLTYKHNDAIFILILFAVTPIVVIPVKLIGRHLRYRGKQTQVVLGDLMQHMHETLDAGMEVRAYTLEERQQQRYTSLLRNFKNLYMKVVKYEKLTQPLMEVIAACVLATSFVYAIMNNVPSSVFMAMATVLYFVLDAVKKIARIQNEVHRAEGAFERVEGIMGVESDIAEPQHSRDPEHLKGEVIFRNVDFAYGDVPALHDIDVRVSAGEVCALVGPSGAGKSTFTKLIPRFYDPSLGAVEIDGHNLRDMTTNFVRSQIAIVPQHPTLFDDTIYNNILMGRPDATEEEVLRAAHMAHADDFIKDMKEGYSTPVGEDGARLSGGQRQRIAIARAFLKNAPILVLDEATSALDSDSEAKIQDALKTLIKGKTVFIIAHRFSTIKLAERIFVFDKGQLAEQGTHEELIDSSELYRRLYKQQYS